MNKQPLILAGVGIFVILTVYLCKQNLDHIHIWKANLAFKNNDIETAQAHFEKAFSLGFNDSKQKNIYYQFNLYLLH